jgi:hypothetical protein
MRTKTQHEIILSVEQMEKIITTMKENQCREPAMSNNVKFQLFFDTDWNAHVINNVSGHQFSVYAECDGMKVIY